MTSGRACPFGRIRSTDELLSLEYFPGRSKAPIGEKTGCLTVVFVPVLWFFCVGGILSSKVDFESPVEYNNGHHS